MVYIRSYSESTLGLFYCNPTVNTCYAAVISTSVHMNFVLSRMINTYISIPAEAQRKIAKWKIKSCDNRIFFTLPVRLGTASQPLYF